MRSLECHLEEAVMRALLLVSVASFFSLVPLIREALAEIKGPEAICTTAGGAVDVLRLAQEKGFSFRKAVALFNTENLKDRRLKCYFALNIASQELSTDQYVYIADVTYAVVASRISVLGFSKRRQKGPVSIKLHDFEGSTIFYSLKGIGSV